MERQANEKGNGCQVVRASAYCSDDPADASHRRQLRFKSTGAVTLTFLDGEDVSGIVLRSCSRMVPSPSLITDCLRARLQSGRLRWSFTAPDILNPIPAVAGMDSPYLCPFRG